ncbi:phosphotriesterase family protein [Lutimonas zeaxanthinifaciens]|uniref:phosphotriesterase family protein n=1 Tax=Lutimonas zeaxanthinifaciens TaxID=3060215 RepID=UPI00265D2050|nr:phosphotriesterase [Lutimonas sp. YSD2104]WKK66490.1 phosphotriesterase [Lutimonas sp. YSD2104]
MKKEPRIYILLFFLIIACGNPTSNKQQLIIDVNGTQRLASNQIWLSHEHILVDFIGADSIQPNRWNHDTIMKVVMPYLEELKEFNVNYFVDATPDYLGRDVLLLEKITNKTGIRIVTNTGLYGARNNKFIPDYAQEMTAEDLAGMWINEYENGIDGTSIRPGFIKIGIDDSESLDPMHQKLVKAAALTHLKTGLTIASHTGKATGLWPQLNILKEMGVSPEAFIWVHAQSEEDTESYLKAAEMGCWISLDGLGWELEKHVEKLLFAKRNGILDRVLISHDSGWYDPQKENQTIKPFTNIFKKLYPELKSRGFSDDEFKELISVNPSKAFLIKVRNYPADKNDK